MAAGRLQDPDPYTKERYVVAATMRQRASVASVVASFIVAHGTQTTDAPPGVTLADYRRQLAQLVNRGVLRIWSWDGYRPELAELAGRYLYVAGPGWPAFVMAAGRPQDPNRNGGGRHS